MRNIALTILFASLFGIQIALAQSYCASDLTKAPDSGPRPATYNIAKVRNVLTYQIPSDFHTGYTPLLISAHRGFWQYAAENSLRAFYAAVTAGIEVIEIDVRVTGDNVPIMMHDDDIARTTTGTGLPEGNSAAQYTGFKLRDRFGCPLTVSSIDHGTTFQSVLQAFVQKGLIYRDSNGVLRGTTLIVDIKGAPADKGANLLTALNTYNQVVGDPAYSVLKGAVVFKAPLSALPGDPTVFASTYGWNANSNNYGLIPVLYPEDPNHATTLSSLINCQNSGPPYAPPCDQQLLTYVNYFFDSAKTQPLVIHVETSQSFNGDSAQAYRDFLWDSSNNGIRDFPIAGYEPENFYPEGEPTGGTCCKEPMTRPWTGGAGAGPSGSGNVYTPGGTPPYAPDTNAYSVTDPNDATYTDQVWPQYPLIPIPKSNRTLNLCLNKTLNISINTKAFCLDYHGRLDFLMSTGMSIFTGERTQDIANLASISDTRRYLTLTYILQ